MDAVLLQLDGFESGGNAQCGIVAQYMAPCPLSSHGKGKGDEDFSLAVALSDDDNVLLHCHGGCRRDDILWELGLEPSELRDLAMLPPTLPDEVMVRISKGTIRVRSGNPKRADHGRMVEAIIHKWLDEEGVEVAQTIRRRYEDGTKEIRRRRFLGIEEGLPRFVHHWQEYTDANGLVIPAVPVIPYGLFELMHRVNEVVEIHEGERCVDARLEDGRLAVHLPSTDLKLQSWFADRDIVIRPDNDQYGRERAERIAKMLYPVAKSIRIVPYTGLDVEGGDYIDWRDTEREALL